METELARCEHVDDIDRAVENGVMQRGVPLVVLSRRARAARNEEFDDLELIVLDGLGERIDPPSILEVKRRARVDEELHDAEPPLRRAQVQSRSSIVVAGIRVGARAEQRAEQGG